MQYPLLWVFLHAGKMCIPVTMTGAKVLYKPAGLWCTLLVPCTLAGLPGRPALHMMGHSCLKIT